MDRLRTTWRKAVEEKFKHLEKSWKKLKHTNLFDTLFPTKWSVTTMYNCLLEVRQQEGNKPELRGIIPPIRESLAMFI